jgi:hypothetical protein
MAVEAGVNILGIIENMSGFVCPKCGNDVDVMERGGGKLLADQLGVSYLGHIPLDPMTSRSTDIGIPYVESHPDSPATLATVAIAERILENIAETRATRAASA